MLDQRLQTVSEEWFACLIHTPLHTRPVILSMMKEWAVHQLSQKDFTSADLLKSLDMMVLTQLKTILTGPATLGLTPSSKSPYKPLPLLGHLAIYSLNLVILRITLSQGSFFLREEELGDQHEASRAWDRLTHVWRSWLSLESLTGVAAVMTARRDGAKIELCPEASPADRSGSRLRDVLTVGLALGDKISAGLAGLHLASLEPDEHRLVQSLNQGLVEEGLDLGSIAAALCAKYRVSPIDSDILSAIEFGIGRSDDIPFNRNGREAVYCTLPSAELAPAGGIGATSIDYITGLTYRYDLELEVSLRDVGNLVGSRTCLIKQNLAEAGVSF